MKEIKIIIHQLNDNTNQIESVIGHDNIIYINFEKSKTIDYEDIYYIIRLIQLAINEKIIISIKHYNSLIKNIIVQKTNVIIAELLEKINEQKTLL